MNRIDIDQTEVRMEDIQNSIDDDPRQIFVFELDISGAIEYDEEPAIKKRSINGTIYMADRSQSSGKTRSTSGSGNTKRGNYYLLTNESIDKISYLEMEGDRFEITWTQTIRGNYTRSKLKSIENGNKTRGYT